jgi:hypothetical protein
MFIITVMIIDVILVYMSLGFLAIFCHNAIFARRSNITSALVQLLLLLLFLFTMIIAAMMWAIMPQVAMIVMIVTSASGYFLIPFYFYRIYKQRIEK